MNPPIALNSSGVFPKRNLPSLTDPRLIRRLDKVRMSLSQTPAKSFPDVFRTKGELDGFYRFVNNQGVSWDKILGPIFEETAGVISPEGEALAIHDTTTFSFDNDIDREGLGRINETGKGFFGHFCLAASSTNRGELLGVLGMSPWVRLKGVRKDKSQKQIRADGDSESLRWGQLVKEVEKRALKGASLIHITDREGDNYELFTDLVSNQCRFVIRLMYNRILQGEEQKLFDSLKDVDAVCFREALLSRREKARHGHPARQARVAKLAISAKKITVKRGWHQDKNLPRGLTLNVVRVFEIETPLEEKPVEWHLVTSEPIEGESDLLKIVDWYRTRWVIEEYFKALKTGCSFEKRGLESYEGLLNCLALFAPIACKLYNLKMLGRTEGEQKATTVLTNTQIQVLENLGAKPKQITTITHAMLAIASLGGHLKHNGPPGWQVMGRGYEKLLMLEAGYLIANKQATPFERRREATSAEW